MKKQFLAIIAVSGIFCVSAATPSAFSKTAQPALKRSAAQQADITPTQALQKLQDGNARFVNGKMRQHPWMREVRQTAKGQHPFAVVLACLDSRTPPEVIFDQGIGDLFCARVAGNVVNKDILGSMEFATKLSGTHLIVVMGHTSCGAVRGAIANAKLGNLTGLLKKIHPAISDVSDKITPRTADNDAFVDAVATANVKVMMHEIEEDSPVIHDLVKSGKVVIAGCMYDVATGRVRWIGRTPKARQ